METIWTDERKEGARAVCRRFAGTPHRNRMAVPGKNGGVDCIHFVIQVMIGAGVIPKVKLPAYDERMGIWRERNIIEDIILQYAAGDSLPPETPEEFGDIVICAVGRQTNHVGIIVDGVMWHVRGQGYCGFEPLVVWKDRTQSLIRLTATGLIRDPGTMAADQLRIAPPVEMP